MTMDGRFSFRRVALLLRSDAECVCPALLKVTLGAGFFLFLYFLATYGYDGSGIISVTTDAAMRWKGSVSKGCMVMAMVFGPSFIYAGMARPDARLAFMMRPASAAEKFVGRLLLSTVGVSALVLLAVAVADLLHLGFSLAAGTSDGLRSVMASLARETAGSVSDIFRPAPHDWPAALSHGLNAVAGLLFFQSLYLLCPLLLARGGFVVATFSAVVCRAVFVALRHCLPDTVSQSAYDFMWMALGLLLAVANYAVAYRSFRRMQLVNGKWFNI